MNRKLILTPIIIAVVVLTYISYTTSQIQQQKEEDDLFLRDFESRFLQGFINGDFGNIIPANQTKAQNPYAYWENGTLCIRKFVNVI